MLVANNMIDLPEQILMKIFRKLDLESLYNLGQTNVRLSDFANDVIETKFKPDWRRNYLAEISENSPLAVERFFTLALERKRNHIQNDMVLPNPSNPWYEDIRPKITVKENFTVYDALDKDGNTIVIIKNRRSGKKTVIPAGDIRVTPELVTHADWQEEGVALQVWKVDENRTEHMARYVDLRNDDFVVEYQVHGEYFLVQYDERTELYWLKPTTPEKIEIPNCDDHMASFEKAAEYFQTWYLDVTNDMLLTRISIRGVTLDWRRRYPSFYLTFQGLKNPKFVRRITMHDTSFEFFGPTKIKSDTTDEVKSVLVSTEPSGRSSYVYDIKTGQVALHAVFNHAQPVKIEDGLFFPRPTVRQYTWSDGRSEKNRKKSIRTKQLRWDGKKFYVTNHNIPLPVIPSSWEKQRTFVSRQGTPVMRDLKVQMVGLTETQVLWEVELARNHAHPQNRLLDSFGPARFITFDFLKP